MMKTLLRYRLLKLPFVWELLLSQKKKKKKLRHICIPIEMCILVGIGRNSKRAGMVGTDWNLDWSGMRGFLIPICLSVREIPVVPVRTESTTLVFPHTHSFISLNLFEVYNYILSLWRLQLSTLLLLLSIDISIL